MRVLGKFSSAARSPPLPGRQQEQKISTKCTVGFISTGLRRDFNWNPMIDALKTRREVTRVCNNSGFFEIIAEFHLNGGRLRRFQRKGGDFAERGSLGFSESTKGNFTLLIHWRLGGDGDDGNKGGHVSTSERAELVALL